MTLNTKLKIKNRGFVLLFTVVLTAIILSIALGVSNISLKEINFSTSVKNTNEAFYAADSGVECALYYDKNLAPNLTGGGSYNVFGVPTTDVVTQCNGVDVALDQNASGGPTTLGPWVFNLTSLGSEGRACALVTVTKTNGSTNILSRGYNIGHEDLDAPNCNSSASGRVERVIEVSY